MNDGPWISDEQLLDIGESIFGDPALEGQRLFDLLSDESRARALEGELTEEDFSPVQIEMIYKWIQDHDITYENYYVPRVPEPEVIEPSDLERLIANALSDIGLEYDPYDDVYDNALKLGIAAETMHDIARDIAETGGSPDDLVDRFEELIPQRDLSAYREQVQNYIAPAVIERNLGAVIPAFSGLDVVAEAAEAAGNDEVRQLADRAIVNIQALEPEKSELRVVIDEAMERTRALAEERREAKLAEARREGDRIAALNEMPESARAVEQQRILEDIRRRQETVDWAALTEQKRQEIAAAQVTPREREGQRFAAMNEMGYELGGAPASAPRAAGGVPGDGAPSWVQRPTGELTSQRYHGPGGHGMGDLPGGAEAPEAKSDDQKFLDLIELGISSDMAYNAVYGSSGGDGQPARPSAAEIEAANREDVEAFLRGQFGGFEFFLNKHDGQLQVGLTSDGLIVDADDPSAMTTKNVLDVIVEQGLTDPGRIEGALGHT
ncbi:MAG: hypothetical protein L7S55_04775, partial [Luminiphilus sp.]|nr:hypothetical protein [Luminiphilus sp.]